MSGLVNQPVRPHTLNPDGGLISPRCKWNQRIKNCVSTGRIVCQQSSNLGPTHFHISSTHTALYGNDLRTTSKDPPTYSCSPNMGEDYFDLRTLFRYLPYKERPYVHEILVSNTSLYKHQVSPPPKYMKFPNSHTIEFLEVLSSLT